ncbi:MAG: homocysteine S-methyltransferase family protein [Kiloniellales bacterium]
MTLWQRIEDGRLLLLDGAMGTELERRGAPVEQKGWAVAALGTHPALVRAVHDDYVRAGADIHTTQTFSAARHVLEGAGLGERFDAFNRSAVALCRDAIEHAGDDRPRWIAGSVSTFAAGSSRDNLPPRDRLAVDFAEQAALLADCGVDLIALEMLYDVEVSILALEAAAATGLPVMLGFTCMWGRDGATVETHAATMTSNGRHMTLEEVLPPVLAAVPEGSRVIVAVMHSEFDVTDAALPVVKRLWDGPIAVYPNSGDYVVPHWQFDTVCEPAVFAEAATGWAGRGAQIVGGCCGLGPDHIGAARERLAHYFEGHLPA